MTAQPTRDQLRALADKATEGPWELIGGGEYVTGVSILVAPDDGGVSSADAEFIAAARTALPQLLDALDQAEAERDRWHSMWRQRGVKHLAAEKRATRAEAQSAIRGRAVVIYRERAREAEARIAAVDAELLYAELHGNVEVWTHDIRRALDT